jgi:hypothetical protein
MGATAVSAGVTAALRSLALSYVGAQRAGGELHTRLMAIERERAQLLSTMEQREYGSPSDREFAEVERVRRTLARSSAASADRLRAIEAVIAAVTREAILAGRTLVPPEARPPDDARPTPDPLPVVRPEAQVRGGWSPPPPDDQGRLQRP